MLSQKCILICHRHLQQKDTMKRSILSKDLFIKSFGFLTINLLSYVEKNLLTLAKVQKKDGSFPYAINIRSKTTINYNNIYLQPTTDKIEAICLYIIAIHTLSQVNHSLSIEHASYIVKAMKYLSKNCYLSSPLHLILIVTAFNCFKDLSTLNKKNDIDAKIIDIDAKIIRLTKYTIYKYWNGYYFNTPEGGFCQKTNAFAIMFSFIEETSIENIIDAWQKLSTISSIEDRLLFLIAIIRYDNKKYLNIVEKKLNYIENKIINTKKLKTKIASLYITSRIALEKQKLRY